MDASKQKLKNQLTSMRLIYYAMCAPIILFSGVAYFLVNTGALGQPDYSMAPLLQTISIIVVPATLAGGYFVFRSGLSKIEERLLLAEKLQKYFVLLMIRGALFESGFLFCFVATILTRELLFLAAAPVMLFIFILLRPNIDSVVMDLNLSGAEKSLLESCR
jgi:hypothetical protein